MRHADAGYEIAINCAHEAKLDLPMLDTAGKERNKMFELNLLPGELTSPPCAASAASRYTSAWTRPPWRGSTPPLPWSPR